MRTLVGDHAHPAPSPAIAQGRRIFARSNRHVDAVVARWRSLGCQPVACDLECAASPTVVNGSGLHPHLGTIRLAQFAVADGGRGTAEALVIDCWKQDPAPARSLLGDQTWPTLIHYARMECSWLGWRYGLVINNLIDTCAVARTVYARERKRGEWKPVLDEDFERELGGKRPSASLGAVYKRVFGDDLDKSNQNSFWYAKRLTHEQLTYAADDVLALLDLWPVLRAQITDDYLAEVMAKSARLARRSVHVSKDHVVKGTRVAQVVVGCEVERALRMVAAACSEKELGLVERCLPYLRLHYTARPVIAAACSRARRRLACGERPRRPEKCRPARWRTPF